MSSSKISRIFISQFSFFTIFPIGETDINEVAKWSFVSPIIVGVPLALLESLPFLIKFNSYIISILSLSLMELIRGFNHIDGLADVADSLMAKGEGKRKALEDPWIGTSGAVSTFLFLSFFLFSLNLLYFNDYAKILRIALGAEIISRASPLLSLATLRPANFSNLGKLFHDKIMHKKKYLIVQIIVGTIISGIVSPIISIMISLSIASLLSRALGGINGDIVGACMEMTLAISIFSSSLLPMLI